MPKLTWYLFLVSTLCALAPNAALTANNFSEEAARGAGDLAATPLGGSTAASVRMLRAPAEQPDGRARSANPLWQIPLENLSVTRERPVFSSSRRPPPVAVAQVAVAKPPSPPKPAQEERPPQLSLVGTVTGGDWSFGIFVDQTSKAALRLRIGEEHQGWILRAVQSREVTFARDQRTIVLNFPDPGTTVAPRVEVADVAPPADKPRRPHVHR